MAQQEKIKNFMADLAGQSSGDVRTDDYSRLFYSTDASIY